MIDRITPKQEAEWEYQCRIHDIGYPSTVHHFELNESGAYFPVLWEDIRHG